jgi:hypothetical protein
MKIGFVEKYLIMTMNVMKSKDLSLTIKIPYRIVMDFTVMKILEILEVTIVQILTVFFYVNIKNYIFILSSF